jgi:hypothetical protein
MQEILKSCQRFWGNVVRAAQLYFVRVHAFVSPDNKSAKELMQHDKLRELAVVLTERVKQNASIDWTIIFSGTRF